MFKKNLIYSLLTLLVIIIHQNSPGVYCCSINKNCLPCGEVIRKSEQIIFDFEDQYKELISLISNANKNESTRQSLESQRQNEERQRDAREKQLQIIVQKWRSYKQQLLNEKNELLTEIQNWKNEKVLREYRNNKIKIEMEQCRNFSKQQKNEEMRLLLNLKKWKQTQEKENSNNLLHHTNIPCNNNHQVNLKNKYPNEVSSF